jgi:hypothetical protein
MWVLRLPGAIRNALDRYCRGLVWRRRPDRSVSDGVGRVYLVRWYIGGQGSRHRAAQGRPCVYLHGFYDSDGAMLHDHPWFSASVIVSGSYIEEIPARANDPTGPRRRLLRCPGDVTVRAPSSPHRIELPPEQPKPVLTLFLVGRRRRRWGFWCPRGWRDGVNTKRRERGGAGPGAGCD